MNETEYVLVGLTVIVVLGVGMQWLAWRLRIPSILLLLVSGFLVGPVTGILEGAVVKATPLTKQFDYEAFRAHCKGRVVCLFLISEGGALTVSTADDAPTPRPGHTLVSLVDPVDLPAEEDAHG